MVDQLQSEILAVLAAHPDYDHRVKRKHLRTMLGVSDRWMRSVIEDLRVNTPEGAYICSSTDGGYWLTRSVMELDRSLAQDEQRAKRILIRISMQRLRARQAMTNTSLSIGEQYG
jgi:hypothetical protein